MLSYSTNARGNFQFDRVIGGAVPVVVCGSWPGLARDRPAARGGVYPHASGVGADGQTASGRHPGAVRLDQVLPVNPAAAVRGPKHVVTKGATPVLTPAETRSLLDGSTRGRWSVFVTVHC